MLVLQFGLSPKYVLDEVEIYEINSLMKYSYYKSKESWEQARLISYMEAQTHTSKKLKIEDIIKFPWEKAEEKSEIKSENFYTDEEIAYLEEQAELMKQLL